MTDDRVVAKALEILEKRSRSGCALTSPAAVRDYLRLKLAGLEHEIFICVWLDAQHRVQNSPTVPKRNRSIARIASAVSTMRITLAAIAAPKLSGPGSPSRR